MKKTALLLLLLISAFACTTQPAPTGTVQKPSDPEVGTTIESLKDPNVSLSEMKTVVNTYRNYDREQLEEVCKAHPGECTVTENMGLISQYFGELYIQDLVFIFPASWTFNGDAKAFFDENNKLVGYLDYNDPFCTFQPVK